MLAKDLDWKLQVGDEHWKEDETEAILIQDGDLEPELPAPSDGELLSLELKTLKDYISILPIIDARTYRKDRLDGTKTTTATEQGLEQKLDTLVVVPNLISNILLFENAHAANTPVSQIEPRFLAHLDPTIARSLLPQTIYSEQDVVQLCLSTTFRPALSVCRSAQKLVGNGAGMMLGFTRPELCHNQYPESITSAKNGKIITDLQLVVKPNTNV
ncbi:hypothetical protein C8T65DRAFT_737650 [Cerioporus squamosus]|nr:hypothetical protein C8T65DRAFT_737650 [Cerioporus squamosus]